MFASSRVPCVGCDKFVVAPEPGAVRHIIVIRRRNVFKLDVQGGPTANLVPLSVDAVQRQLEEILAMDNTLGPGVGLGVLTMRGRDEWAADRANLAAVGSGESQGANAAHLEAIDTALFTLVLDDDDDARAAQRRAAGLRRGVFGDPKNRWYDKPMQLIVAADGTVCSNAEHSWGDGLCFMRWGMEVAKEISKPSYLDARAAGEAAAAPTLLDFELDMRTINAVDTASREVAAWRARTDLDETTIEG